MLNGTVKRYGGTAAARFVRRTLLAAAALCAAGQVGAEENLLSNAGFEAGTSGWVRLDPPLFKVVDGQGYGGTKGLVWENDDPRRCLYPRQIAKVKVGHVYRFSGLVKTESLKGKGKVVVCFEWVTKENKWSKGFQAKPVDDNGMLRDGWVRYEGVTPPMPPPAERGAVILYVEGSVGRVRFDDFTLIECEKRIIDGIMSSRVRDEAVDGEVRFAATLNLDVAERPLSSYAVDLSYRDSNGAAKIAKPSTFTEEQAVFKLDVADLAMGAQDLELAVKEAAGGRTIAKASHRFTRLAAPSRRRVSFDARGRMLLDGKVVFPLGMYTGRMSAEDLEIGVCLIPETCHFPAETFEADTGRRQLQGVVASPVEEFCLQFLFQLGHGLADGRLRDEQQRGSLVHAAGLRYGQKELHRPEVHGARSFSGPSRPGMDSLYPLIRDPSRPQRQKTQKSPALIVTRSNAYKESLIRCKEK